jgi:hypothetical protein
VTSRGWTIKIGVFLAITVVFSITYTQSPLFTSNQNQYFLHGLARAGWGFLSQDWLANTLDPTPVFSALTALVYQLFHQTWFYYLIYAVLLGGYFYSLLAIVAYIFPIRQSRGIYITYIALLLLIHSAALRFSLSRTFGANWTYLLEDGLADQRLLGPVLQPSAFGISLLVSIALFLRRRAYLAVLLACLAATIHPTYLLSAASLTLAYMIIAYREERKIAKPLLIGALALAAVAPILWYTYTSFAGASSETAAQAQAILVNERIPHHALASWWFDATAVVKILLVLLALYLVRKARLFLILLVPFGIALTLTVVQVIANSHALALVFPWRLSTWLVPISTSIILAYLLTSLVNRYPKIDSKYARWLITASILVITVVSLVGIIRLKLDFDRQANAPEWPLMAFVGGHKRPGEVYLIPVKMQDFRLAAGAPVYVDFKSIPYRDSDVLEWQRRIQLAERFYQNGECSILDQIVGQTRVTHVVFPAGQVELTCPDMALMYKDEYYALYQLSVE